MAVNKTINIDINQNADEAAKGFNNLNKSLDATNESIRDVNATFEQVYGELQPLTTRLGEAEDRLYELALAGDTTSKEYQELLNKVAEYRKVQIQTDLVVDSAATTLDQKMGGALQGAVSGFAAVQGGMALVGVESESLEQTLLKVQAALALSEGIKGVRESISSVKQLGQTAIKALSGMSLGAGALIGGAIAAGVAGFVVLMDKINTKEKERQKRTEEVNKKHKEEISLLEKAYERQKQQVSTIQQQISLLDKQYDRLINIARAKGQDAKADELTYEKTIEAIKKNQEALDKVQSSIKETKKELVDTAEKSKNLFQVQLTEEGKINQKRLVIYKQESDFYKRVKQNAESGDEAANKMINAYEKSNVLLNQGIELNKEQVNLQQQIADLEASIEVERANRQKAANERAKEYNSNTRDLLRQIEDEQIKRIVNDEKRQIEELQKAAQRRIEDLKNVKASAKRKKELTLEIEKSLEFEITKLRQQQQAERDKIENERLANIKQQENEFIDAIAAIQEQNYLNTLSDQEREERAVQEKYFTLEVLAEGNADALAEIEIAKMNELNDIRLKYQEEDYQNQKTINEKKKADIEKLNQFRYQSAKNSLQIIADLTEIFAGKSEEQQRKAFKVQKGINIANATIDTYQAANVALKSAPPPFNYIAMAAAITTGILNIKKIASTQFEGNTTPDTTTPDTAGLEGGAITPQFNVVGDSGINQLAQLQQQPVQAYVVSGEVTSAQALDRNRVKNATL